MVGVFAGLDVAPIRPGQLADTSFPDRSQKSVTGPSFEPVGRRDRLSYHLAEMLAVFPFLLVFEVRAHRRTLRRTR